MKKYFPILLSSVLLNCSNNNSVDNYVPIDLNKKDDLISYSLFSDSLSYLTIEINNNLIISGAERVYIDGDYLFIQDNKKQGIFVFSLEEKSLISNINYFGKGPGEFYNIRTFTINPDKKQVIIFSYPFLHKYTYGGTFVESIRTENNIVDFYCENTNEYICIAPEDMGPGMNNGVWLADSSLQYLKHLKEIPDKQMLFTRSTFYNRTNNGIYYYDRVWEDFSFITRDSAEILYKFDFKQAVPAEKRLYKDPWKEVADYFYINTFAYSDRYILLNYYKLDGSGLNFWVLFDTFENKILSSRHLLNDISNTDSSTGFLFYIDNRTWGRFLESKENENTIHIELIHLKK